MLTTSKYSAWALAKLLSRHGVRSVVSSPGSRNAPIVAALARSGEYEIVPVIDERCAAFIGLGMALTHRRPVALVCTSGSAMLNYAPALAEAYYRHIPLIVVSADRPRQWIDQDDSQTIVQPGALSSVVKHTVDIPDVGCPDYDFIARDINEALNVATKAPAGPVHINIQLSEPLGGQVDDADMPLPKVVTSIGSAIPSERDVALLADDINNAGRVLVLAGFGNPSASVTAALDRLSSCCQVLVGTELTANIRSAHIHALTDDFVKRLEEPDLVITLGGALLSKAMKQRLRSWHCEHWCIGHHHIAPDCYGLLTRHVEVDPEVLMPLLAEKVASVTKEGETYHLDCAITDAAINDDDAVVKVMAAAPEGCNLQLSNGLTVRRAVNGPTHRFHRIDCNRGVSGIEGSVSTALGMALADTERVTLLITGDMSMAYDVASLGAAPWPSRLKVAVINNGGGGIFRRVESTRNLPELERYFVCRPRLPLAALAQAYGIAYYTSVADFFAESSRAALLEVCEGQLNNLTTQQL